MFILTYVFFKYCLSSRDQHNMKKVEATCSTQLCMYVYQSIPTKLFEAILKFVASNANRTGESQQSKCFPKAHIMGFQHHDEMITTDVTALDASRMNDDSKPYKSFV